ncbi:MAG TPA: c-type cytochrome [Myxococcota bacterium]|nr:c-type cytochrome [Myxococcota bacterium]
MMCLALVALCSASVGCGEEGGPTGATCPTDSTLTYTNFGQTLLSNVCLECHNGRRKPNLSTQAAVQANIAAIDRMAAAGPNAVNTAMPDDGPISNSDRRKLGEWLACGAP